jgi:hypothetical protein
MENSPISMNDPDGDCPTCKGGDEVYEKGATVENKQGKWEYQGDHKWKTISLALGKSSKAFQEFFEKAGGEEGVDKLRDAIIGKEKRDLYQFKFCEKNIWHG